MGKQTVKRRIFISNALMVVVMLFILLMINSFVIKMNCKSDFYQKTGKPYHGTFGCPGGRGGKDQEE